MAALGAGIMKYAPSTSFNEELLVKLEAAEGCLLGTAAALLLVDQLGAQLLNTAYGCRPVSQKKLREFRRLWKRVEEAEEYFKQAPFLDLYWADWTAIRESYRRPLLDLLSLSEEEGAELNETVRSLSGFDVGGTAATLCVKGASKYTKTNENNYAHHMWGHFYPAFVAVAEAGHLHPKTRLVFQDPVNVCPKYRSLSFYHVLFDTLPAWKPKRQCRGPTVELSAALPIMSESYLREVSDVEREATWTKYLDHFCRFKVLLHRVAVTRLQIRSPEVPRVVYVRRGELGAATALNAWHWKEAQRNLLNDLEVQSALLELAGTAQVEVLITQLASSWAETVRVAAGASMLLGLHGSAIYSAELWMPPGAVHVAILTPNWCECRFAYCGAADPARDFLFVLASNERPTNCSLGLSWLASDRSTPFEEPRCSWPGKEVDVWQRLGGWGYTRSFQPQELLLGLREVLPQLVQPSVGLQAIPGRSFASHFKTWALGRGHREVCGGYAVQMVDKGQGWLPPHFSRRRTSGAAS